MSLIVAEVQKVRNLFGFTNWPLDCICKKKKELRNGTVESRLIETANRQQVVRGIRVEISNRRASRVLRPERIYRR